MTQTVEVLEQQVKQVQGQELHGWLPDGRKCVLQYDESDPCWTFWVYEGASVQAAMEWRGETLEKVVRIGKKYKQVNVLSARLFPYAKYVEECRRTGPRLVTDPS